MAIYKRGRGFELGTTEEKSSKLPEGDSNPGPPDCESYALTTRPLRLFLHPVFVLDFLSEFAAHVVFFILQEIEHLTHLEQYTLSSDLSQGYALKMLAGK